MRTSRAMAALGRSLLIVGGMIAAGSASRAGAQTAAPNSVVALDPANRDETCAPCNDFYKYANGGWLATAKIPASYSSIGSFRELRDKNEAALHEIMEAAVANLSKASAGSADWKLAAYYGACMDSSAAEAAGSKPIEPELKRLAGLKSKADITAAVSRLHRQGVGALFRFGSEQDAKNSSEVIAGTGQGGLGLPDRDYYTKTDSASVQTRAAYLDYMTRIFTLFGAKEADARRDAERVMALETALAQASMTNVQRRDPKAVYHRMKVDELRTLAPSFNWTAYLTGAGLGGIQELNVAQPDFFKAVNGLLDQTPMDDWKAYLRWKVARDAAPVLSSAFVDADFAFERRLSGAKEMLPRWKRCLGATDNALGEVLGQEYARRYFTGEAKARALAMVENLEAALGDRIAVLDWMGDSTRVQAKSKLDAFYEKIGYPDQWRDYSKLEVKKEPFVLNRWRARAFEGRRQLDKIGKPVDRNEWGMTPPTVNAYYSSSMNSINFPAGILQLPFYDASVDDAINYGGIGAVIGHEMTHGFDDRGRQFDGTGNLRDWWTPADADAYRARAKLVEEQFSGYVAVDSLHVNGKLTLGENIADLGGLAVAYAAFEKSMEGKPRPPLIDGLTPEQRFFMSWAQVWRQIMRSEQARTQAQTDPHSPGRWRVNGPLANLPEFAKAFGCKDGDPMVRPAALRARIW